MFEPFVAKRRPKVRTHKAGRATIDTLAFNQNLTEISIDYAQRAEDFVHWQATPNVEVKSPVGVYKAWDRADSFRIDFQPRRPGEAAAIRKRNIANLTYKCEQFALAELIPDEEDELEESILDEDVAVRDLTHNGLMERERAWMATYFGVAIWANNVVGTTDFTKWSSTAPAPLIFTNVMNWKDIVRRSCGMDPNVIVFAPDVWVVLCDDADIQDRISQVVGGPVEPRKVTRKMIAALFEVDYVLVARATRNTALEGAAMTGAFFASDSVLMLYRPDTPSIKVPSGGYCFSYSPFDNVRGDTAKSGAASMLSWYENKEHSTYVEAQMYYVFKVVDPSAGIFASDVL